MNRTFISLYLILVLAIVLFGSVLNKFWEQIDPPVVVDEAIVDLMAVIEAQVAGQEQTNKSLNFPADLHYQIKILEVGDFASSNVAAGIKSGAIVNASDETANRYYKLTKDNKVIALTHHIDSQKNDSLYVVFIVLFYGAIALVIFLWVWPLTRDLTRLVQHTRSVSDSGVPANINISSRSLLAPFATAFNTMAKRLSEIMRSQKEMTYAVSHELRTPLARMKFALAMTETTEDQKELMAHLDSIKRDIAEMENLINSLLTYANFEQKAEPLQQREGHMEDMVDTIIKRLDNPLSLRLRIYNQAPQVIFSCEWMLMQTALQNLLQNALGFARQNIVVTMGANEQFFWVTVEDDGPGVPETQREYIFHSFIRLYGESDLNRHSGFGLGLAIVKRIMTWHGGTAICTQSAQGGAKFTLQWPKI